MHSFLEYAFFVCVCNFVLSKKLYYMKQANWNPHQKGSSSKSWSPEEWAMFTEANQFFSESKKKKNRGKKRQQWWADKQAGKKPRAEWGSGQQTPSADGQLEVSQEATEEATVFPPEPPGLHSAESSVVPAKARPASTGRPSTYFPRMQSPSIHGDSPGALFHFPAGTTMWIPQRAMEHMSHGMPGGQGQAFLDDVVFPFNRVGWSSQLAPTIHVFDDDEEQLGAGGSSSSTARIVSKRVTPPWKRQGK